jgi:transposase
VTFRAELFVAVLGASSYTYAEATRSQELLFWVGAHVNAFEYLGGTPAIVVCDNLRSGVTRPHRYEPDVNATYSEMAAHYNVAIIPAAPGAFSQDGPPVSGSSFRQYNTPCVANHRLDTAKEVRIRG